MSWVPIKQSGPEINALKEEFPGTQSKLSEGYAAPLGNLFERLAGFLRTPIEPDKCLDEQKLQVMTIYQWMTENKV